MIAPPHAAGAVDVTVVSPFGIFTARNALRYFDPAAPVDPSTHATILFPLYFNGSGAYGSQWQTIIDARNRGDVPVVPLQAVFPTIPARKTASIDPRITVRERGVLLHVPRELLPQLSFAAFARDISRESERWGAELPVVREEDFATELELIRVPLDPRFRVTLRVYTIAGGTEDIQVSAFDYLDETPIGTVSLRTVKRTDIEPGFAIIENLRDRFTGGTARVRLSTSSGIPRLWAFLTVTNNETQQVTVITAQ